MTGFFSDDPEMALLEDEVLGHMFQPVGCQASAPEPLYAPSLAPYPALSQPPSTSVGASFYELPAPIHLAASYGPPQYWHPGQAANTAPYAYPIFPSPPATLSPAQTLHQPTLLPDLTSSGRPSRSPSASSGSTFPSLTAEDSSITSYQRQPSPGSPDLRAYGYQNPNGTWSCAYDGCTSRAVFTRGCDLRKHYKRHTKSFFCRHEGCPQATGGGFSSKKDLARHEAKHNPGVICEWEGCDRVFSRVDNMRDHVKRIHMRSSRTGSGRSSNPK